MVSVQQKYEHAVIATDVALFTVEKDQLKVLLMKMTKEPFMGKWALPGGLVGGEESVDAGAIRVLQEKAGVTNVYLEQFGTFGEVDRDPFGRVVSVAYFALVSQEEARMHVSPEQEDSLKWVAVQDVKELAYDHEAILAAAVAQLQTRLSYSNIAYSLLPRQFTLTQLQRLYEVILDTTIDKRNFRKRVLASGLVVPTGKKQEGAANRPAALYRFASRTPQQASLL